MAGGALADWNILAALGICVLAYGAAVAAGWVYPETDAGAPGGLASGKNDADIFHCLHHVVAR